MVSFNLPLPDGYYVSKARITEIYEDRIGAGNRDGIYNPERKDGLVLKIGILAEDYDNELLYAAVIRSQSGRFKGLSRIPHRDEVCYVLHEEGNFRQQPFVFGKEDKVHEILAMFDLEGKLLYAKPDGIFLHKLRGLIPMELKLDVGSL